MKYNDNPGSDESLEKGCTCPVLDNGHGNPELGRVRGFYITKGCPLHDKTELVTTHTKTNHHNKEESNE